MPPLICASPTILDQSFPRNNQELDLIVSTLGTIQSLIENDEIHLILTKVLQDLLEAFNWEQRVGQYPILRDIYRLLCQWFLQPHARLIQIDDQSISNINHYVSHPLPEGSQKCGLVEFWSDEVGKLLAIHDLCCPNNKFFIGIACESAFSGSDINKYDNPNNQRTFPLVGPENFNSLLIDAYEWDLPQDVHQKQVSLSDVKRNIFCIGGQEDRSKGDHFIYVFEQARSWPLTLRDPVPNDHLRQLVPITGFPLPVIKYALMNGELPIKKIMFSKIKNFNTTH